MEYDRALYRVYERVLEDLTSSDAVVPVPPSSSSRQQAQQPTANGTTTTTTTTNATDGPSLPYFLPLQLAFVVEFVIELLYGRLTWDNVARRVRRVWYGWRARRGGGAGGSSYSPIGPIGGIGGGNAGGGPVDEEMGLEMNDLSSSSTAAGASAAGSGGAGRGPRGTTPRRGGGRGGSTPRHVRLQPTATFTAATAEAETTPGTPSSAGLRRRNNSHGGSDNSNSTIESGSSGTGGSSGGATTASSSGGHGDRHMHSDHSAADEYDDDEPYEEEEFVLPSTTPSSVVSHSPATPRRRRRGGNSSGDNNAANAAAAQQQQQQQQQQQPSSTTRRRRVGRRQPHHAHQAAHRRRRRQRRQQQRQRSTSSSSDSTNSSDSDSSNDTGDDTTTTNTTTRDSGTPDQVQGCTQRGLYVLIRTSAWVGWASVAVLYCLHSTYVSPRLGKRGRYKSGSNVPMHPASGGPTAALGGSTISGGGARRRRLAAVRLADEEEDDEQRRQRQHRGVAPPPPPPPPYAATTGITGMATCLEYALSTRPADGTTRRSDYFDTFGDEDDDDDDDDADEGDGDKHDGSNKKGDKKKGEEEEEEGGGNEDKERRRDEERDTEKGGRTGNLRGSRRRSAKNESKKQKPIKVLAKEKKGNTKNDDGAAVSAAAAATKKKKSKERPKVDPPLLGRDEVLQIKILYDGVCTGQCSRVRNVVYPHSPRRDKKGATNNATNATAAQQEGDEGDGNGDDDGDPLLRRTDEGGGGGAGSPTLLSSSPSAAGDNSTWRQRGFFGRGKGRPKRSSSTDRDGGGDDNDPLSAPSYWDKPHYRFATDEALLHLDAKTAHLHNISVVNVTVTERCLATGSDHGPHTAVTTVGMFLSQIFGMDAPIVNQVMYGIRTSTGDYRNGYLQNVRSKERWSWKKDMLESYDRTRDKKNFVTRLIGKVGSLLLALLSFFLITSVTSLIVRVLTSSGVVMMFPMFALFRHLGLPGADDRILGLSYPWIGRARTVIGRRRIHPDVHLIGAHVAKIFLYYVMYEACQAAWSVVLYGKSIPEALPIWIYGFTMVWEYFNMVFVRSALSAYFFPRITLLYFVLYHLYFYSVPYGYFDVALIPWFLFMVQAMFYTILALEVPAVARGAISVECPREVFNRLSWPEWTASLPQEWTLFLPLNSRYTPLYDREVSDIGADDVQEEEDQEANNNMNGAGNNEAIPGEGGDPAPTDADQEVDVGNVGESRLGLHSRGSGTLREV